MDTKKEEEQLFMPIQRTSPRIINSVFLPQGFPMALMNEQQASANHYQSLKTLRKRGGMSAIEILANVRKWSLPLHSFTEAMAMQELIDIVKKSKTASDGQSDVDSGKRDPV